MDDILESLLEKAGISGIVTNWMLVAAIADTDGNEKIINLTSDGTGVVNHLGLAKAASLTAEQRYYEGDDEDD